MLEELEVPATWAVVGHLFLESCPRGHDGTAHPELLRPSFAWYPDDWFSRDPCTDRARDPLWYGDDIVDLILAARVPQEMASHSFSHLPYGDRGCPEPVAAADLAECIRLAEARGVSLRSFVFPRNIEGHHGLLQRNGFIAYRGRDQTWFERLPGRGKRVGHFVDQLGRVAPPVSRPTEALPGLWNIPGSMVLIGRDGVRKFIPLASRVAKARAGLRRAVAEEKMFHLWLHPSNLASDPDAMLGALRAILTEAARLRERGSLEIHTMHSLATGLVTMPPAGGTLPG
jgi:hypothetical protein